MTGRASGMFSTLLPPWPRGNPLPRGLGRIGQWAIALVRPFIMLSSMVVAVLWQSCRPRNWRRTIAEEFLRQCYAVGIGSLPFILVSSLLIGMAMVFQLLFWLGLAGQSEVVGKVIVMVGIREIAPLLVALIIVGRSGSVNMVELGHMHSSGQLHMLDAQGVDVFLFILVPRCLATALALFCLTMVFILVSLGSGYVGSILIQTSDKTLIEFMNQVLAAMGPGEYAIIVLKPLIIGMLVTLITCTTGLSVEGRSWQVAHVLPGGFVKSFLAVFLVSGILSVLL